MKIYSDDEGSKSLRNAIQLILMWNMSYFFFKIKIKCCCWMCCRFGLLSSECVIFSLSPWRQESVSGWWVSLSLWSNCPLLTDINVTSFYPKYTEEWGQRLGLVGWVRNTSSGTVVGQVQGPAPRVEQMSVQSINFFFFWRKTTFPHDWQGQGLVLQGARGSRSGDQKLWTVCLFFTPCSTGWVKLRHYRVRQKKAITSSPVGGWKWG